MATPMDLELCGQTTKAALRAGALMMVASCAHGTAATPSPSQPQQAPQSEVREPEPRRAAAPAAAEQLDEAGDGESDDWDPVPPRIEDFMDEHFVIATWSRDAVINGHVEALREPLHALADFDYRPVTPEAWMPRIAQLQATARITADAESLEAAAAGVAILARQCGDCHEDARTRAYYGPDIRASKPKRKDSLLERMDKHIWAADRMWEGLTAPSDSAWDAGAAALASVPEQGPTSDPPLSEDFKAQLRALRALGKRALAKQERAERADLYASLLVSCARCHVHEVQLTF